MKKYILFLLVMLSCLAGMAQTLTAKSGVSMTGGTNGYYEFLPSTYNGTAKLPVIIFIHGLGEVGNGTSQLGNILNFGLPNVIAGDMTWFNTKGAICIMPQFSSGWPGPNTINNVINYVRSLELF